jgi:hypothetical protein
VGQSLLVREQPRTPLIFVQQLAGDRPVLIRQLIEGDVGVRLRFKCDALQGVGDLFSYLGFLFAAQRSGNTDVYVRYGSLLSMLVEITPKHL